MKTGTNKPWVFYDQDCAICRRAVWVTRLLLGKGTATYVPLQNDWVRKLFGLSSETLLEEMKLLTVDRRRLGGADAILYLMGRVWWLGSLAGILGIRPIHVWVDRMYRWVARRRYCLEGGCALPAREGNVG